ncbi:MAG: hypothetical protein JWQ64_378 [Subtercola sp.]|nr:hypothetical protein [Subtercola sp.]
MTQERRNLWWVWVIVGVVVVAAIVGAFFFITGWGSPSSGPVSSPTPTASNSASATPTRPPTPSATPTATVTPTPTPTPIPTSTAVPPAPGAVVPFITSASWDAADGGISVSAFVPEIVESGGTCTITATSGAATATASFPANASATTTDCGSNTLASSTLTTGAWNVVVSYSSPASSGASAVTVVEVP